MPLQKSLDVRNIGVDAGGTALLTNVHFRLYPGELCALLGPSGAGKSTLIKVLLGIRKPGQGSVSLPGEGSSAVEPVGYVPQDDALHQELPVARELTYAARLRLPQASEEERIRRVEETLASVGLGDRRSLRIKRLSGGQRKRVSVALELLTSPSLLILDEPTSGLDPGLEARMMALFADVAGRNRIVIVATHAMESLNCCRVLLILVRGHLVFAGDPADALSYFQVDRYAELFPRLEENTPESWSSAFFNHALRRKFDQREPPPPIIGTGERASASQKPTAASSQESAINSDLNAKQALAALKRKIRGQKS